MNFLSTKNIWKKKNAKKKQKCLLKRRESERNEDGASVLVCARVLVFSPPRCLLFSFCAKAFFFECTNKGRKTSKEQNFCRFWRSSLIDTVPSRGVERKKKSERKEESLRGVDIFHGKKKY
jgi:hypothetical protein